MPSPETLHHREVRHALREVKKEVEGLEAHQFDYSELKQYNISVLPMDLDEGSNNRPIFFKPCDASLLLSPDEYDKGMSRYSEFDSWDPELRLRIDCASFTISYISHYISVSAICSKGFILNKLWSEVSTSDEPFQGLWRDEDPEFGTMRADQLQDRSSPHMKAMLYNDLDGRDGELLRGEILVALCLTYTQMRRRRLYGHMTAPVLLFSFVGPQHARVIEAYFDGTSFMMRSTPLFDFRKKDETLIRTFAQWYLGEPAGDTEHLWKG